MDFKELMKKDISTSNDFGGSCLHYHDNIEEDLQYLSFDLQSDVVLDQDGFEGMQTCIPSLQVSNTNLIKISYKSIFKIDDIKYKVLQIQPQNDGTTKIYLGKQNA